MCDFFNRELYHFFSFLPRGFTPRYFLHMGFHPMLFIYRPFRAFYTWGLTPRYSFVAPSFLPRGFTPRYSYVAPSGLLLTTFFLHLTTYALRLIPYTLNLTILSYLSDLQNLLAVDFFLPIHLAK